MTELSDRYRRLLRWYPRNHRGDHEEEMLGVLMTAARPGQVRPTLRETTDLIRGGMQVRASRAIAAEADTGWRDALAVIGLLIPMVMSLNAVRLGMNWWSLHWLPFTFPFTQWHPDWSAWAIWPLVAVLALFGVRRTATIAATVAITWWAAIVAVEYLRHNATAAVVAIWWPLLGLLAIAGLAVGPGPRRGIEVLRRNKTLLAAVGVLLAVAARSKLLPIITFDDIMLAADWAVGPGAVIVGVLALSSPVGRRLLVLLSTPAATFFILDQTSDAGSWSNYPVTHLFPIVAISFAVFITSALVLGPTERGLRLARRSDS